MTPKNTYNQISRERFFELVDRLKQLPPVIVVGDIGIDKYTYGEVRRISPEAPVPVIDVDREWTKLGMAANVSHNLISLGVRSSLCGVVGDDANARVLEKLMEESGIGPEWIIKDGRFTTILKERVMTKSQQICRIDYESLKVITPELEGLVAGRVERLFETHGALILDDYCKGIVSKGLIAKLVEMGRSSGKIVAIDPGRTTPPTYYRGATILKPNYNEARAMVTALGYHEDSPAKMAEILIEKLRLEMLIITLGGEGMALMDSRGSKIIPTVATEVFDVSGAGDTALSLITIGLLAGGTLEEAAWLGNCGAGVVVGKSGTATVNIDELRRRYDTVFVETETVTETERDMV